MQYTVKNWPVRMNKPASDALKAMQHMHLVIPIPAYDMHCALIELGSLRKMLEGAVVQVRLVLRHWSINGKKSGEKPADTYMADLEDLLVLIPPLPTMVSPWKRKVLAMHPESPTKKRRI